METLIAILGSWLIVGIIAYYRLKKLKMFEPLPPVDMSDSNFEHKANKDRYFDSYMQMMERQKVCHPKRVRSKGPASDKKFTPTRRTKSVRVE